MCVFYSFHASRQTIDVNKFLLRFSKDWKIVSQRILVFIRFSNKILVEPSIFHASAMAVTMHSKLSNDFELLVHILLFLFLLDLFPYKEKITYKVIRLWNLERDLQNRDEKHTLLDIPFIVADCRRLNDHCSFCLLLDRLDVLTFLSDKMLDSKAWEHDTKIACPLL